MIGAKIECNRGIYMAIKNRIKNYEKEMISVLAELVAFNSVNETATKDAPFGQTNKECLEKALTICERYGLRSTNLDNYIGYGEIGNGADIIGVLGHLDVVPAGEGWNFDPFELTQVDRKLFGRGTSDDKGPVVAALFALKVLQDEGYVFNKRVRLIMGSNEEMGSACLKHYVEKEGHFQYGFTPDAFFPGVFGEKGSIGGWFGHKSKIIDVAGGLAGNVVCNHCTIKVHKNDLNIDLFSQALSEKNLKFKITDINDTYQLDVYGIAAHASTPEQGVNAISFAMEALKKAGFVDDFVDLYNNLIGLKTDGSLCGIKLNDKYGSLTLNVGVIKKEDSNVLASLDIRVPITIDSQEVANSLKTAFSKYQAELTISRVSSPLFFEPNSPLVLSLLDAYQKVTHDYASQPGTMGGGTYARGVNNCIGFGGVMQNDNNHMHDANEFIDIDQLLLQTEIYVQAIKNLCKL